MSRTRVTTTASSRAGLSRVVASRAARAFRRAGRLLRRAFRPLAVVGAGVVLAAGLAACSTSEPIASTSELIAMTADTVVIDVRTAGEYASGHLDGAINLDVDSGSFEQEVGQLPRDLDYVVYCKSGNRAGTAVAIMRELGFTSVVNAGSVSSASSATGIAVVTG